MAQKIARARWFFDRTSWVPTVEELNFALSSIHPEERDRVMKYVFYKDAIATLSGRLMIRKFLAEATGLPWADIAVGRDENEKPIFPLDISLQFNVSHQGKYTIFAGESSGAKIGVDIMEIKYTGGKPLKEFFRLMSRQFSKQEWEKIHENSLPTRQERTFYRLWSLKESYIKATGVGMKVPLKDIDFRINSPLKSVAEFVEDTELFLEGEKQENWKFQEVLIDENYGACVAIHCQSEELKNYPCLPFCEVMAQDLLKFCTTALPADEKAAEDLFKKYLESEDRK
ncbi:4'-phosphopantetheinyl transferase superfamily [Nesidiocoris tenuis]|uniref:L-aminoadipate-semialdehyde dehydrogenase-phosphopantetheinyl transferase n=1 Tax=Nesidiocoris tenuis TaxID=355587 RepID=A0ABN7AT36_9HEMI|nr:4'-phosphopantetheinyl transferase superfamily [Nesidiocoris tenuis]